MCVCVCITGKDLAGACPIQTCWSTHGGGRKVRTTGNSPSVQVRVGQVSFPPDWELFGL